MHHQSADDFSTTLYNRYQDNFIATDITSAMADTLLSPEFLQLIRLDQKRPEGDRGYLSRDPLCDCQDPEGVKPNTVITSQSGDSAAVRVRLCYMNGLKNILFKTILCEGKWHIRNIGSKENPSLYEYLRTYLKKDFLYVIR